MQASTHPSHGTCTEGQEFNEGYPSCIFLHITPRRLGMLRFIARAPCSVRFFFCFFIWVVVEIHISSSLRLISCCAVRLQLPNHQQLAAPTPPQLNRPPPCKQPSHSPTVKFDLIPAHTCFVHTTALTFLLIRYAWQDPKWVDNDLKKLGFGNDLGERGGGDKHQESVQGWPPCFEDRTDDRGSHPRSWRRTPNKFFLLFFF